MGTGAGWKYTDFNVKVILILTFILTKHNEHLHISFTLLGLEMLNCIWIGSLLLSCTCTHLGQACGSFFLKDPLCSCLTETQRDQSFPAGSGTPPTIVKSKGCFSNSLVFNTPSLKTLNTTAETSSNSCFCTSSDVLDYDPNSFDAPEQLTRYLISATFPYEDMTIQKSQPLFMVLRPWSHRSPEKWWGEWVGVWLFVWTGSLW